MFVLNYRRCSLPLKLMNFVLNVLKSCTLCPLALTKLIFFFVKYDHVHFCNFIFLGKFIFVISLK
ncbi:hypothetical protein Hanom_Chr14g01271551 [Helianthus anomalus]